jgi:hypothetical protein
MTPNKSLKALAALTGTVQTGAASHCRAAYPDLKAMKIVNWPPNLDIKL